MSVVLSEEHAMLKEMAGNFFRDKAPISLNRKLRDESPRHGFCQNVWAEMVEMGWSSIHIPEEYGGLDFGFRGVGIVMEEAGRTLAASPMLSTVALGASALVQGGSREQKADLLPAVAAGELLLTLAVDEDAHHDPSLIEMTATKSANDYILKGEKHFVMDADVADRLIVAARTSGERGTVQGLTLFLVDKESAGLTCSQRMMVDNRSASSILLNNVRLTESSIIGEVDSGGELLERVLDCGRVALAAEMLGSMQAAFDAILAYIKDRKQFGQSIGSFQALQHRAAIMFSDIEQCKSVVYEALNAIDDDVEGVDRLASLAKAMVNDAYHNISSEGIQMHGGMGMTDECDMGFYLKRARVSEQSLGSSNYHRSRYATLSGF